MKNCIYIISILLVTLFSVTRNYAQVYNFSNYTSSNGLSDNQTTSLIQDSRGYLWIGTNNGLSRFDGNSFANYDSFHGLSENSVSDLKKDSKGNLFVYHPNGKVTVITKDYYFEVQDSVREDYTFAQDTNLTCSVIDSNAIQVFNSSGKLIFELSTQKILADNLISSAIIDRENILWISTLKNGIYSLPLQNFPTYLWEYGTLKSSYKLNNETHLLTFNNNIIRLRFENNKPIYTEVYSTNKREMNCAIIQFGNELFYGTNNGMYLYFNETKNEFSFNELANKKVTYIEKIGNGDLIIIADNKIYIYLVYSNEIKLMPGLENVQANSIQKINNEIYLLAKGDVFLLKNKSFESILRNHNINYKQNFTYISKSNTDKLWLTTSTAKVFLYDPKQEVLTNFSKEKNIPLSHITTTIQDENYLWITSKDEVIWYDIDKNIFSRFGSKYLNKKKFLPYTITNKNKIFLLSKEGLIQTFDSKSYANNTNILHINSILVQGKSFSTNNLIEVKHNSFPVQFNYQSISLKEKTYYQTKLEGHDKEWSKSTLKTTINYQNLKPGNYTFRVRTIDPFNEVVLNTDSKKFKVLLPYWKTSIFFYILFGVLTFILLLLYLFRVLTLQRRAKKLEKLVYEKTYVLSAQNQNIEQFSYSLSHDLKNPINNIKGLVEIMPDTEDENQNEIKKLLMNSAKLLENKIKATLKSIEHMQANKRNVELVHFNNVISETRQSLLLLIKNNDVKFYTHFNVSSIVYSSSIIDSIFYNMISNSIKYGSKNRKTIIKVSSRREGEVVVLEFEDNGIGIDMEKDLAKIFSIFERVEDGQATGSGLGLYMVKQMIELNGGSISVSSEIGVGTKFTIKLTPMK